MARGLAPSRLHRTLMISIVALPQRHAKWQCGWCIWQRSAVSICMRRGIASNLGLKTYQMHVVLCQSIHQTGMYRLWLCDTRLAQRLFTRSSMGRRSACLLLFLLSIGSPCCGQQWCGVGFVCCPTCISTTLPISIWHQPKARAKRTVPSRRQSMYRCRSLCRRISGGGWYARPLKSWAAPPCILRHGHHLASLARREFLTVAHPGLSHRGAHCFSRCTSLIQ